MDCTPENPDVNEINIPHEEWYTYQSKRLDRIIEANKKLIEKTEIVLSK